MLFVSIISKLINNFKKSFFVKKTHRKNYKIVYKRKYKIRIETSDFANDTRNLKFANQPAELLLSFYSGKR